MAISNYYVDPAGGNDTTGDGTIGTPWATVQKALDTITRNSTDGDQINVKAGTADTLAATLSLATYGTPTADAPLVFRGYTATANDGGRGEIDGDGQYSIYDSSANSNKDYVRFVDMKIGNCGAARVIHFRFGGVLVNCEVYGSSADGGVLFALPSNHAVACLFHSLTGATNVDVTGIGFNAFEHCVFRSSAGAQILRFTSSTQAGLIANCIFDLSSDTSLHAINVNFGGVIIGNTIYSAAANTSTGIIAYSGLGRPITILNNIISGFSGAGGIGLYLNGTQSALHGGNAFYNCTTAVYDASKTGVLLSPNLTLAADPFVDAASGDFRLKTDSEAIEAAWPGAFPGYAATTNAADIGAVQRGAGASGGGGPVVGSRVIRGLGAI